MPCGLRPAGRGAGEPHGVKAERVAYPYLMKELHEKAFIIAQYTRVIWVNLEISKSKKGHEKRQTLLESF